MSEGARERVAVLLDSDVPPNWVCPVLSELDDRADLAWVAVVCETARARGWRTRATSWLRSTYGRIDRRRYAGRVAHALEPGPAGELASVPIARLRVDGAVAPDDADDALRDAVVIDLRLAPGPLDAVDRRCREHWFVAIHTDEGRAARGARARDPVFWATTSGARHCDVELVVVRGHREHVAASSTIAFTTPSLAASTNAFYGRAAELVVRELRRPSRGSTEGPVVERVSDRAATMSGSEMTAAVVRSTGRRLLDALRVRWRRRRHREQWILGLRRGRADADPRDATGYDVLPQPPDRTFADPFPVCVAGSVFVFFEEVVLDRPRGVISVLELGHEGQWLEPRTVLTRPYHLSYPHVFEHDGEWYMVPESAANRTIDLYRARAFPDEWELVCHLLVDVAARDTTLLRRDGRWWLFTAIESAAGRHDELSCFFATELTGPWQAHPRNPLVSDVRCARPAGAFFESEGELVRPAQDCSERYGGAVVFRRVVTLDQREFHEEPFGSLPPIWRSGLLGVHTYNRAGDVEVVDGLRTIRRSRDVATSSWSI